MLHDGGIKVTKGGTKLCRVAF